MSPHEVEEYQAPFCWPPPELKINPATASLRFLPREDPCVECGCSWLPKNMNGKGLTDYRSWSVIFGCSWLPSWLFIWDEELSISYLILK
jgi:hypothetical protein